MNKRYHRGDYYIALLSILLGFVITLQLRSVTKNSALDSVQNMRAEQMVVLIEEERKRNDSLTHQLNDYKSSLESYREEAAKSGGYASGLESELHRAEILAGLADVEGPGVIVTMTDKPGMAGEGDVFSDVIHDSDILNVINELRVAGAEVLSLNEERILATSEIRCAGSTVSINNRRYAAPYVIRAIGEPSNLESALNMRHGVVEVLSSWGIEVSIVKSNKIRINAASGPQSFQYATPAQKKEG